MDLKLPAIELHSRPQNVWESEITLYRNNGKSDPSSLKEPKTWSFQFPRVRMVFQELSGSCEGYDRVMRYTQTWMPDLQWSAMT